MRWLIGLEGSLAGESNACEQDGQVSHYPREAASTLGSYPRRRIDLLYKKVRSKYKAPTGTAWGAKARGCVHLLCMLLKKRRQPQKDIVCTG